MALREFTDSNNIAWVDSHISHTLNDGSTKDNLFRVIFKESLMSSQGSWIWSALWQNFKRQVKKLRPADRARLKLTFWLWTSSEIHELLWQQQEIVQHTSIFYNMMNSGDRYSRHFKEFRTIMICNDFKIYVQYC